MSIPNLTLRPGVAPTEGGAIGSYLIDLDTPAPAGGLTVNFNTDNSSAIFGTDYKLLPLNWLKLNLRGNLIVIPTSQDSDFIVQNLIN
jgi:hypothetical protein